MTTSDKQPSSSPTPIAAQFFSASPPLAITAPTQTPPAHVLTNQQPHVTSYIAGAPRGFLPPPQQLPPSGSSVVASDVFADRGDVPELQPPFPVSKIPLESSSQSLAPSQPHVAQVNVLSSAPMIVSAPTRASFPPPRPNPVSRFTPPSSPIAATANRNYNFPVPRRAPLVLPRPKLPSPRSSPGGSSKFGAFKLPTPAKRLPLPRPGTRSLTPVISKESAATSSDQAGRHEVAATMETKEAPKATTGAEISPEGTPVKTPLDSRSHSAPSAPIHLASEYQLSASEIEREEEPGVHEPPARMIESEAVPISLPAAQELQIVPEVPSVQSRPDSPWKPPLLTPHLPADHAEVSGHPDPQLNGLLEEPVAQVSESVVDIGTVARSEALPEGWIEQHDPNTCNSYYIHASTNETTRELHTFTEPPFIAVVNGEGYVGGDENTEEIEDVVPSASEGDESQGKRNVPDTYDSDLDVGVADPGAPHDEALPKEWVKPLDPSKEKLTFDNASTSETLHKGPAYGIIAPVYDTGANAETEDLDIPLDDDVETIGGAYVESSQSSVAKALLLDVDASTDDTLPEGWSAQQDPATGNIYFYNASTLQTTWSRPSWQDIPCDELENVGGFLVADQPGAPTETSIHIEVGVDGSEVVDERLQLSKDWTEVTDPTTGDAYYYNQVTKETSWVKPTGLALHTQGDDNPRPSSQWDAVCPSAGEDIASEEAAADEQDDDTDTESGESPDRSEQVAEEQTVLYENDVIEECSRSPALPFEDSLNKGWVNGLDSTSGGQQYSSESMNDRSWDMSSSHAIENVEGAGTSFRDGGVADESDEHRAVGMVEKLVKESDQSESTMLPPGWSELVDPMSGKLFFYCSLTNESTWERPSFGVRVEEPVASSEAEPGREVLFHRGVDCDSALDAPTEEATIFDPSRNDPETEIAEEEAGVSDMSIGLPSGWASGVDPSSAMTFYFNGETGETSWDPPVAGSPSQDSTVPHATVPLAETLCDFDKSPEFTSEDQLGAEPESTAPSLAFTDSVEVRAEGVACDVDWIGDMNENEEQETSLGVVMHSPTQQLESSCLKHDVPPAESAHLDEHVSTPVFGENDVVDDAQLFSGVEVSDRLTTPEMCSLKDGEVVKAVLPMTWIEETDPNTGQSYFFNPETLESSWERPAFAPDEEQKSSYDSSGTDERVIVEDTDVDIVLDDAKNQETAEPGHVGVSDTSTEWTELVDPASGRIYYFQTGTGETSWERPNEGACVENTEGSTDAFLVDESVVIDGFAHSDIVLAEGLMGSTIAGEQIPFDGVVPSMDSTVRDACPDGIEEVETIGAEEKPAPHLHAVTEDCDEDSQNNRTDHENPELQIELLDEPVLPMDWVESVDPSTGNRFYFNEVTGETSWDRPLTSGSEIIDENRDTMACPELQFSEEAGLVRFEAPMSEAQSIENVLKFHESELTPSEIPVSEGHAVENLVHVRDVRETELTPSTMPMPEGGTLASFVEPSETGLEPLESHVSDALPPDDAVDHPRETEVCQLVDTVRLPGGWVEEVDPASGSPYYVCEATNETSWERPVAPPSSDRLPLVHHVAGPSIDECHDGVLENRAEDLNAPLALPSGWVAFVDPTSGNPYYFNASRNTTLWEVPIEIEREDDVALENVGESVPTACDDDQKYSGLHDGWVEVERNPSGQASYPAEIENIPPSEILAYTPVETESVSLGEKNPETESTAMVENVTHDEGAQVGDTTDNADVAAHEGGELLDGWVDIVDVPTGKHYYFNEASGDTTWERPVRMPISLDPPTSIELREIESVPSHDGVAPLPKGWIAVEDRDTGGTYYFNEIENKTTWDLPTTDVGSEASETGNDRVGRNSRPTHAFASFGFGGRLCVFRASPRPQIVEMHRVCHFVPSHPVIRAEKMKHRFGIVGALNDADSAVVTSYIRANAIESTSEFLWSLIQIASQSEGRLRSDEGVTDLSSPESSIIQLLLQAETSPYDSGDKSDAMSENDVTNNRASLHSIESLLLHGKREEAVQEAIASQQFAMALLVASMCDRSTFQHATKKFAEQIASSGSPLYTLALLFSGQLDPPPDSALEMSGLVPTVWSESTEELRYTWKQHMCAIISNRILGWDRIVLSLGDRLLELGDVHAAHCCYMVCGCPVASIVHPASRMSLVGCDHLVRLDAALMTDAGIAAFCRSEAYEWAKRRGNPDAVITSLQGFKLAYAMILADLGYEGEAGMYVKSIRDSMGVALRTADNGVGKKTAPTIWALADSMELQRFIDEFDQRLSYRETPHRFVESQTETSSSFKNTPTTPVATVPFNSADTSVSFHSTTSHCLDGEEHAYTQLSGGGRTTIHDTRRTSSRQRLTSSKLALGASRLLKEPAAASSNSSSSPSGLPPSLLAASYSGPPVASFHSAQAAEAPPNFYPGSNVTRPSGIKRACIGDENAANMPSSTAGPPKTAVPLSASPGGRMPLGVPVEVIEDDCSGIAESPISQTSPIPPTLTQGTIRDAHAPSLASKKEPLTVQKQKKLAKAPSSAPAELQRTAKSPGREPTSAQKRAWGLGGFRDRMTKWLNPDATTADLGGGMEAYYDEDKKVWVFPGEDPAALAQPIGPPPITTTPVKDVKKVEGPNEAPVDPLAAMMAPPPRTISSLRRQPVAQLAGLPAGIMRPPGATAAPTTPAAGPPKFMVFTPKAGQIKEDQSQ